MGRFGNLEVRPLTLAEANQTVAAWHRHHDPAVGHRFSLAAVAGTERVGVAICGRPVGRMTDQYETLEVLRCCTNGHANACSFLYGACARVAREMGFASIQTFTLGSESGATMRAAGWVLAGVNEGGQ